MERIMGRYHGIPENVQEWGARGGRGEQKTRPLIPSHTVFLKRLRYSLSLVLVLKGFRSHKTLPWGQSVLPEARRHRAFLVTLGNVWVHRRQRHTMGERACEHACLRKPEAVT